MNYFPVNGDIRVKLLDYSHFYKLDAEITNVCSAYNESPHDTKHLFAYSSKQADLIPSASGPEKSK